MDAYLNCGDLDYARELATCCTQNERGEYYCTTVYYKLNITHDDSDL